MNEKNMWMTLRFRRALLLAVSGLVVLAGVMVTVHRRTVKSGGGNQPTFVVRRGPMTISVAQAGTIQAAEQQIISSEVQGSPTLIYLIEEGSHVKKGDLLAQIDESSLQDNLVVQQILVQNAEAAYIRARETLAVTKNQSESDISLAKLNARFATEDLPQYTEGQYKQDLMVADSKITMAEQQVQLAAKKQEWSEKLLKENYIAQSELDADRLAYNRAKLDLELARAAKSLLEEFTFTRKLAQLKSDMDQTERTLERAQLKASADTVQASADLKAKESEWHQQQEKEIKITNQIAKTRILAPRDGLVIYATSVKSGGFRGNQQPLEAGQQVRERQELIYLPMADTMIADIQVSESNLEKVRLGLPVIVTVDALKGRSFAGKITRIAPLPDAMSLWMNPDLKVYQAGIAIEGRQSELRSGMSCMTEIVVDRYEDALSVPVQAVLRVNNQPTVYIRQGDAFQPVSVKTGLDNNRMIRIVEGLREGDTVLLTPPLQDAARSAENRSTNGPIDPARLTEMIREARDKGSAQTMRTPVGDAALVPGTVQSVDGESPPPASRPPEQQTATGKPWDRSRTGGARTGGRTP